MNTPNRPETMSLSARVSPELRARIQAAADAEGHGQTSITVRAALTEYADRRDQANALLTDGVVDGTAHRAARAAEYRAKMAQAPKVGTDRYRILGVFVRLGGVGCNASEVIVALEGEGRKIPTNGAARRVTDLLEGGLIRPAQHGDAAATERHHSGAKPRVEEDGSVTRVTTNPPARGMVYVATPAGHRAWAEAVAGR